VAHRESAPVIIIKKKPLAHKHHGGAWKVAYADFVTAMMALFIVLWLMNTSENVKKVVGGYFQDPRSVGKLTGTEVGGSGMGVPIKKDDLPKLRQKLEQAMKKVEDFSKIHKQVQIMITPEGLRVELMETQGGFFFKNGSPAATPDGKALLTALAKEIAKVPNHVLIEGYTDAAPYHSNKDYSNWELSVDRANAARRLMEAAGVRTDQVSYVRGFADRQLKDPANPLDPANRRVSLIIQYQQIKPDPNDTPQKETSGAKSAKPI
jgi:chemotaxis protein MotB